MTALFSTVVDKIALSVVDVLSRSSVVLFAGLVIDIRSFVVLCVDVRFFVVFLVVLVVDVLDLLIVVVVVVVVVFGSISQYVELV